MLRNGKELTPDIFSSHKELYLFFELYNIKINDKKDYENALRFLTENEFIKHVDIQSFMVHALMHFQEEYNELVDVCKEVMPQ
jgi:hypothetical protein